MKKSTNTRRSLVMSILAMLVCVAMLAGSTFAWFTDTATSGVNKIVAGNLDLKVEYSKDGNTWSDFEGSTSLFTGNLWEPGHTEVVYLKISNVGNLNFNYKALVSPVSENGGINVEGNSFKLSDYLYFGTTAPADENTTYTRETARAAVEANAKGISVDSLVKDGTLAPNETKYAALVVYMPEDVGNEANYLTGTTAPTIELGITIRATQQTVESDSFDNQYDAGAVTESEYVAGAYYDYFKAENKSAVSDGDKKFAIVGEKAAASGETENVGDSVNLTVVKTSAAPTFSVSEGNDVAGYDIKVTGQKEGSLVQSKLCVGTGLQNFKFYHNSVEMTVGTKGSLTDGQYFYDSTDGYVYFASTTFSPFHATYTAPVASIGSAVYGSLADAISAVKDGETITMLKSVDNAKGISVASGKNFTVDFNGYVYTVNRPGAGSANTQTQAFQLLKNSTITFKDGTICCAAENKNAVNNGNDKPIKMIIQNYANLTLDNMVIDGTNMAHNQDAAGYVTSNNNGNTVINNTTIKAVAGDFAFDSYYKNSSAYTAPTVTVKGNSVIDGKVEVDGGNLVIEGGIFTVSSFADIKAIMDKGSNFVIDGKGATIDFNNVSGDCIYCSGTVELKNMKWVNAFSVPFDNYGGTVTLTNIEAEQTITNYFGTVNVVGGKYYQIQTGYGDMVVDGATVTGKEVTALWSDGGSLVVKAGTFGVNPTNFLDEGLVAVEKDGVWTVKAA